MSSACKFCGTIVTRHQTTCVPCANEHGLCSICMRPQTPGFKTCARCRKASKRQKDRTEARTGKRNALAEWQIHQVEECRQIAAQLHEKFTGCQV